jgi:hypothetical protein
MRLNVDLKSELYRDIAALADEDGCTLSEVVRGLLIAWREQRWAQRRAREADRAAAGKDEKGVLLG